MQTLAVFQPSPADPININTDIVAEVLEYDPYGRGSSEVTYRSAVDGREHRTSTRYIQIYTIGD